MRKALAESLLTSIMGWTAQEKASERARLESFASYKYDEYQQFSPGRRFIESLALWLRQFDVGAERRVAYDFVCNRLIFFSASEMNHLVELTFPTIVRPLLLARAAEQSGIEPFKLKALVATPEYRTLIRRTLFLGMSDGAHTDWFRRANPIISNEQIFHAYDLSDAKSEDMVANLKTDISVIKGAEVSGDDALFETIVLLDDFTASGTSAIRYDEKTKKWKGKIPKIIENIDKGENVGATMAQNVQVIIIAYIASDQAIKHIDAHLPRLPFSRGSVDFRVVCRLGEAAPLDDVKDADILALADDNRYFDTDADDVHSLVGGSSKKLGYSNGRLPVVLAHNTPNNSIYIIWAEDAHRVRGLFPRISRHRKFQQS